MKRAFSIITVFALILTLFAGIPAAAENDDYSLVEIPLPTVRTLTNLWDMATARSGYPAVDHSITASVNHYCTPEITVAAGDVFCFGPCNTDQGFHIRYWNSADNTTAVGGSALTVVDTFDNGQAIYQYTVPAAGKISIVDNTVYNDCFFISKGRSFTVQDFHNYWDAKGGNLYRPRLDKTGAFLNADGSYNTSSNHNCTHFIAVSGGDTITFGPAKIAQDYHLYGFNSSKQPVTGMVTKTSLTVSDTLDENSVLYTYTVPANVSYVRIVNHTTYKDKFVVAKNNVLDAVSYYELLGITVDPVLFQKTILCVGDSICQGSRDTGGVGSWAGRLARDYGMLSTNNGVSGASISTCREARFGMIVSQLEKAAGNTYDYVLLHGGVNDAWDSVPVGGMSESFDKTTFKQDTFGGALEYMIARAIELFGDHAAIGYLINFRLPHSGYGRLEDMAEYFDLAKKICDKWGISYFDMYNNAEINAALDYDTTHYTTDHIHPNSEGYDILTPYIADYVKTLQPLSETLHQIVFHLPGGDQSAFLSPRNALMTVPDAVRGYFFRFNGKIMRGDLLLEQNLRKIGELTAVTSAGDLTRDGYLSIADAVAMLRALNRGETIPAATGDVSGSGATDIADAVALMRILNG